LYFKPSYSIFAKYPNPTFFCWADKSDLVRAVDQADQTKDSIIRRVRATHSQLLKTSSYFSGSRKGSSMVRRMRSPHQGHSTPRSSSSSAFSSATSAAAMVGCVEPLAAGADCCEMLNLFMTALVMPKGVFEVIFCFFWREKRKEGQVFID